MIWRLKEDKFLFGIDSNSNFFGCPTSTMSPARLVARLMQQTDVDEVMQLHQILFPVKYTKDVIESFLDGSYTTILLTKIEDEKEEIIGVSTSIRKRIFMLFGVKEGYLSTFGIHPSMRQLGLGTDLLKITAFILYRRFHCLNMTLNVQAINDIACKFYYKFGFKLVQENPNYYSFQGDAAKSNYLRYDLTETTSLDLRNDIQFSEDLQVLFSPSTINFQEKLLGYIVFLVFIFACLILVKKINK